MVIALTWKGESDPWKYMFIFRERVVTAQRRWAMFPEHRARERVQYRQYPPHVSLNSVLMS